jgi:DNA mismatch repair protein MutS2
MDIKEVKEKLEFERIVSRIEAYLSSDLGLKKCDEIEFIRNRQRLETELDKVLQAKELTNIDGPLDLGGLKDISPVLERIKIEGNYVQPEQYLWVLKFLRISRNVSGYFAGKYRDDREKYALLTALAHPLFYDKVLEHNIEITIDETGIVKDSASAALRGIRQELRNKEEKLRKSLAKILKNVSEKEFSQDDIVTQRDGRFVIPVKTENKRYVPGIIHSTSASGATVFIEPGETIELNNDITELQFKEKREIEKILIELSKQIAVYYEQLKNNCEILAEIDFVFAKARYAIESISDKPKFSDAHTNLVKAFHPILIQTHSRKEVVPLDITLGDEFNTLVVTGPNAGGKTVSLKTVGLLQLMLQSGILIPVDPQSEMRLYDEIFINIGDQQSIENDLSTFSSHLKSLKHIIDNTDEDSLILIDEICSGTDPNLGSALSAAILRFFSGRNAKSIVTTHIGELKKFAYNTPRIENASLEFDYETLSPNFKFVIGVPGQSFTFEIAEKFNYPDDIISDAKGNVDESETQLEDLIKELNENKQKYANLKNKTDIENARLKGLVNLYEQKNAELKETQKELINNAKKEARLILQEANRLVEKTIKEVRENQNFSAKEIKTEFAQKVNKLTHIEEEKEELPQVIEGEIKPGDTVRLKDSNTTGEVIEVSGSTVVVNANGLTLKSKVKDLEKISRKELRKSTIEESKVKLNDDVIYTSLDIRGVYPSEVQNQIEKFLYDSYLSGLHEVSIIHGKGTGKLRDAVKNALKRNSMVKSSRLGNWNEGEAGVTIVEI